SFSRDWSSDVCSSDLEQDYYRGVGRIVKGAEVLANSFAASVDRSPARLAVARVPEIKANILIPIVYNDDIVAMLNVDSFSVESRSEGRRVGKEGRYGR